MEYVEKISEAISLSGDDLVAFLMAVFASLSAVGVVSMAIIEVAKSLFVRNLFNALMFRKLVSDEKLREEVCRRCVCGSGLTFYTLKADEMIGRLKEAIENALVYPSKSNTSFILTLAKIGKYIDHVEVEKHWKELLEPYDSADMGTLKRRDELREGLMRVFSAKLDNWRIWLVRLWELALKVFAIGISVLIIFNLIPSLAFFPKILFAVLGGMVAPVSHDVLKLLASGKRSSGSI